MQEVSGTLSFCRDTTEGLDSPDMRVSKREEEAITS